MTSFLTSSGGPSNPSAVVTTIYKATEVFRDRITKLIYVESNIKLSFSLWPVPNSAGSPDLTVGNMYLFSVNSISHVGS